MRDVEHRHVMKPWMPPSYWQRARRHARCFKRVGVGDALVAQRVVPGDHHDGGRQPAEVGVQAVRRRDVRDRRGRARTDPNTTAAPASGCRSPFRIDGRTRCRSRRRSPGTPAAGRRAPVPPRSRAISAVTAARLPPALSPPTTMRLGVAAERIGIAGRPLRHRVDVLGGGGPQVLPAPAGMQPK